MYIHSSYTEEQTLFQSIEIQCKSKSENNILGLIKSVHEEWLVVYDQIAVYNLENLMGHLPCI